MINLNINDTEKEDLRQFLQHCRNWLTVEVHHTDTFAFRERLKQKEKLIDNLLEQLDANANSQSPAGCS